MTPLYKVHIGYTATGRDKWRKFETLDKAKQYCAGYFESSGLVLSIIAMEPRQ